MNAQTGCKSKLARLALITWIGISCLLWANTVYAARIRKIAVLPYKNLTGKPELNWIGEGLAQYIANKLAHNTKSTPVDRFRLETLIYYQIVDDLTTNDPKEAQTIGKQVGAPLLIYGNYQQEDGLKINTYLMDVNTGKLWTNFSNKGPFEKILDWQDQILLNLLERIKVKLTPKQQANLRARETTSLQAYERYTKARLLLMEGEAEEVVPLCQQIIMLDPQYVQAVSLLIKAYELNDQWEKIPALYQKYESILDKNQDKGELKRVYDKIITIYSNSGKFELALKYCRKKLDLVKRMNDIMGVIAIYNKIGNVYRQKKEFDKAISFLQKGLKLLEKQGNQTQIANTYNSLGDIYFAKGLYVVALKNYNKALGIWRLKNDRNSIAISCNKIGRVMLQQKDYYKALNNFNQAADIHQRSGQKSLLAGTYKNIADLYLDQENHNEAMDYYHKAMRLYEKEKEENELIAIYDKIGSIHLQRNQLNHALVVYQKMVDIQDRHGDPGLCSTYSQLGNIYLAKKAYNLALRYFEKSLETQLITGNRTLLGETYDKLADFHQQRGDYQEALRYYLKKTEYCRTGKSKACQAGAYFNISHIYDKMSRYDKAINYLKMTIQIERKLNGSKVDEHLDYLNQLKQKSADQKEAEKATEEFQ